MIGHAKAEEWASWLNKRGQALFAYYAPAFAIFFLLVWWVDPGVIRAVSVTLLASSPLWLPFFLGRYLWITWIRYIRFLHWLKQEHILLEIQLPAEVEKSPLAMELFLTSLFNTGGEPTAFHRMWLGSHRPAWSLEIASIEGRVRFYLYLRKGFKNIVEARLYGQYPEAKVVEVPDYTSSIPFNTDEYSLWGCEYKKTPGKPHALPIKTYVDYGLDKNPDTPEIQTDPITHILELLGSSGPGEYHFMQIVMKAHKKDEWYGFYKNTDKYIDEARAYIKTILVGAAKRSQTVLKESWGEGERTFPPPAILSDEEKNKVEAMERALNKLVFECGIRVIYFAKKDKFDGVKIPNTIGFFSALRGPEYNALGPTRGLTVLDFPWQDFSDIRKKSIARKLWFRYKNRAYFYEPFDQTPVFLNVEELATIWHFPSSVVKTPSIDRVPSKRAEAPLNLPTLPT